MVPQCPLWTAALGINFHSDWNEEPSWQENNYLFFINILYDTFLLTFRVHCKE